MIGKKQVSLFFLALLFFLFAGGMAKANKPVINEILINGDFEQDLAIGWQVSTKDIAGRSVIYRAESGENHYAYLLKEWCGYAQLQQIVKLKSLNQVLSFRLRLNARSNRKGYFATAAFIISFLDDNNKSLAETKIAYSTTQLSNTSTSHFYLSEPGEWKNYLIDLKKELNTHFPKIDIGKVKRLKIALATYNNKTSGC